MNENDALFIIVLVVLLFFILATCYWYRHFNYATELYCQSSYSNNVVDYEQCKKKDLVILFTRK